MVVLIAVMLGFGYFGLPLLIEKETERLRADVQTLQQRLDSVEAFVKSEEELRQRTQLRPDADLQSVVKTINAVSHRIASLEGSLKKNTVTFEETLSKQKSTSEEAFKKQGESIDKSQIDCGDILSSERHPCIYRFPVLEV